MNIINQNLIRINAAYLRQKPSECAQIIKQVYIHASHLEQDEKKKHFIDRFIYSPTFLELIRHASEHRKNDMLTVLLLALDPTNPKTEITLKAINLSKKFDVHYVATPSAELINDVCNLEQYDSSSARTNPNAFFANKRRKLESTECAEVMISLSASGK